MKFSFRKNLQTIERAGQFARRRFAHRAAVVDVYRFQNSNPTQLSPF